MHLHVNDDCHHSWHVGRMPSHHRVDKRRSPKPYGRWRQEARDRALTILKELNKRAVAEGSTAVNLFERLSVTDFSERTEQAVAQQWTFDHGAHGADRFPWEDIIARYHQEEKSFGFALWLDGLQLVGLCVGQVRDNAVRLDFMQRRPDGPRKALLLLALETANQLAALAGKQYIDVHDPLAAIIPTYRKHGFAPVVGVSETTLLRRSATR